MFKINIPEIIIYFEEQVICSKWELFGPNLGRNIGGWYLIETFSDFTNDSNIENKGPNSHVLLLRFMFSKHGGIFWNYEEQG